MEQRTGPIPVGDAVREEIATVLALEQWRRSGGESTEVPRCAYTLGLREVQVAEAALGVRLPPAVLAIMASRSDELVGGWGLRPGAAVEHTVAAREAGLPGAIVAIGARGPAFVCFDPTDDPTSDPWFTVWRRRVGATRQQASYWVSGHVDRLVGDLDFSEADLSRVEQRENLARFMPCLVVDAGASDKGPSPWAKHATFGRGRVLRWVDNGAKVEVDFGAHGRRLLASRFVELEEEPPVAPRNHGT